MKNFNVIYTAGNQANNFHIQAADHHEALVHACEVIDLLNTQIVGWFKLVKVENI